jgi:hypothetical protein
MAFRQIARGVPVLALTEARGALPSQWRRPPFLESFFEQLTSPPPAAFRARLPRRADRPSAIRERDFPAAQALPMTTRTLKQIDASGLNVGHAEVGPAGGGEVSAVPAQLDFANS